MPHITANGIDTHYDIAGHGRPVLFIHGGFGGAESTLFPRPSVITGVLPEQAFLTISYDRRNSGRSEYTVARIRVEDLAADAHGLLQALGIPEAVVVGDSLGGMIAMRMALDFPHSVTALVLMETGAMIFERTNKVRAIDAALRIVGEHRIFRLNKKSLLNPTWSKPVGPEMTAGQTAARAAHDAEFRARLRDLPEDELFRYTRGLVRTYMAFSGRDLGAEMDRISAPVHIIHGTADTIVPIDKGRDLHQRIAGSKLHVLDGLGHGLLLYEEGRDALRRVVDSYAID
jgi:pimeloyl-ACP methyl ester carboxylesterase